MARDVHAKAGLNGKLERRTERIRTYNIEQNPSDHRTQTKRDQFNCRLTAISRRPGLLPRPMSGGGPGEVRLSVGLERRGNQAVECIEVKRMVARRSCSCIGSSTRPRLGSAECISARGVALPVEISLLSFSNLTR